MTLGRSILYLGLPPLKDKWGSRDHSSHFIVSAIVFILLQTLVWLFLPSKQSSGKAANWERAVYKIGRKGHKIYYYSVNVDADMVNPIRFLLYYNHWPVQLIVNSANLSYLEALDMV